MAQSYRQFILNTLQLEPLVIAGEQSRLKHDIWQHQQRIRQIRQRTLVAAGAAAWLLLLGLLVLAGVAVLPAVLLALLAPAALAAASRWTALPQLVEPWLPCRRERRLIAQAQAEISRLRQRAITYQQHLEPANGPGLLAVFADILTHPAYVSCFSVIQRRRFVDLSISGQGSSVDIIDYASLLLELKNTCYERYCSAASLVEQVMPQNKIEVALAYASLLGQKQLKVDADDVRFAALIGLNALLTCQQQGLPAQWHTREHRRWELARQILQLAFQQKTLALAKVLVEFEQLQQQAARRIAL